MFGALMILSSSTCAQISLGKVDMQRAYQEGKCCKTTNSALIAETCEVEVEGSFYGGQLLFEMYKEAGCCSDPSCVVTLEECPLCTDTSVDLYRNLLGVQTDYYLSDTFILQNSWHYEDQIDTVIPLVNLNSTTTYGLNDFIILKHPSDTDSSYALRITLDTLYIETFGNQIGCKASSAFTVDYVPTTDCTDFLARTFVGFETKEMADECQNDNLLVRLIGPDFVNRIDDLTFYFDAHVKSMCDDPIKEPLTVS